MSRPARTSPTVRPLTAADVPRASAVLGAAFGDDPIMGDLVGWSVPSADRARRLTRLFRRLLAVELARPSHLVTVSTERVGEGAARHEEICGVALWHEVDEWRVEPATMVRSAIDTIAVFRQRTVRTLRVLAAVERVHPTEPHRYLEFLGVDPTHQGRGHGGRLLTAMRNELDEQGLPAYLESSDPRNEALYVRHGFQARSPIDTVRGGPVATPMWRPALG